MIKITFCPIHGSGTLAVDFLSDKAQDGASSIKGAGYYWLSLKGELASVQFTDVNEFEDSQKIVTEAGEWVEVRVAKGSITISSSVQEKKAAA